MKIGIPKEIHLGEKRVATTPEAAAQIIKLGFSVSIETGAGINADISDEAYQNAGVEIVYDTQALWQQSDIILKVRAPEFNQSLNLFETQLLAPGSCLISFIWPAQNEGLMQDLAANNHTVLAMDSVPRMSRAQKLDALSSMANIEIGRASCRERVSSPV